eukprot:8510815-Karenia_brevis.AAC.1
MIFRKDSRKWLKQERMLEVFQMLPKRHLPNNNIYASPISPTRAIGKRAMKARASRMQHIPQM